MTITINGDTGIAGVDGTASVPAVQGNDTNTGLFYPAADTVGVSTGGSERMRVDSSGNVGIGTSSPGSKLQVVGPTRIGSASGSAFSGSLSTGGLDVMVGTGAGSGGAFQVWDDNVLGTPRFMVTRDGNVGIGTVNLFAKFNVISSGAPSASGQMSTGALVATGDGGEAINFGATGGYSWINSAYKNNSGVALPMAFFTGATERARIDSSGNLLVGTMSNTNSSRARFVGTSTSSSGVQSAAEFAQGGSGENGGQIALLNTYSGVSNPNKYFRVDNSGNLNIVNSAYNSVPLALTDGGNLTISGATAQKASGTTWSNPSDQRLKNNIRDYDKGISELMQVKVREWEYNGKGGTTENTKGLGVIADEIMTVLPETVDTYAAKLNKDDAEETDIKRFDATEIIWLLVKSVQQLKAELDALKASK